MAGLDPAIHVLATVKKDVDTSELGIPSADLFKDQVGYIQLDVTSPGMTAKNERPLTDTGFKCLSA
jgi:hypothetical protein